MRFLTLILRRWLSPQPFKAWLVWLLLSISLGVAANPVPAGTTIQGVASATYIPGGFTQTETVSNVVEVTVLPVEALTLTQDQKLVRPPAMSVTLSHLLKNTGNATSDYILSLSNDPNVVGCPANPLTMTGLRLLRDVNGNGLVDGADVPLALDSPNVLSLRMGEAASLLVQGTMPLSPSGAVCLSLSAKTVAQNVSARNQDIISLGNAAILALTKSARYDGLILPGRSRIDFTVTGNNIGAGEVLPTDVGLSTSGTGTSKILVDQKPVSLILLRDKVPTGTHYVAGTLASSLPGAIKLYRLSGDPEFQYRTNADDASAIEVAIGLPLPNTLVSGATWQMRFAVTVDSAASSDIFNTAQTYYHDGVQVTSGASNTSFSPLALARIGIAKAASAPLANQTNGVPNGTSDVTFSLRIKNYGNAWLYGVQVTDLMEGLGSTQFGQYTVATSPGQGEYTIVPGTLKVVLPSGALAGTSAQIDPDFKGTNANANLLKAGAVLPAQAEFNVEFTARFNTVGRVDKLYNSAAATAYLAVTDGQQISDDSVSGLDPDPDGDGNPSNNSGPTPVESQAPVVKVAQYIELPQRVSPGVYDIRFNYYVSNTGAVTAPFVRVISNLNCTFSIDLADGMIAGWTIVDPVKTKNGLLKPSANFTGNALCDRSKISNPSAYQFPTEIALTTVDGTQALEPGKLEEISFMVRVTVKSSVPQGTQIPINNKVWAAAFTENTINFTPSQVLASSVSADASSVPAYIVDPAGTVYNAKTRAPVAGAKVIMTRESCTDGTAEAILRREILGGETSKYEVDKNGSIWMVTQADGAWDFSLRTEYVKNLCTYRIDVVPPANSGYNFPSQLIKPSPDVFIQCGAVVNSPYPPKNSDPTTYHLKYESGLKGKDEVCAVTNAHIPLDPGNADGLVLKKEANQQRVEFGDFVDYMLTLTNRTETKNKPGTLLSGVTFTDDLPVGFAYVPGSAKLSDGSTVTAANPTGGVGPHLEWKFPGKNLAIDQSMVLRFRVRVGVGAPLDANVINRAQASAGVVQSNQATHTIRVDAGVFSDKAFLFGKVYLTCQKEGAKPDMVGIPGVRLWLEDGTFAVTDADGKWSLYGLRPQTHVVRLDETTLPKGTRVQLLDNRNAGNPASRFADLKKGEFHKADFPVAGCDSEAILGEVNQRKAAVQKLFDAQLEADARLRIDPKGAVAAGTTDTRSLPATGSVGAAAGLMVQQPVGSGALIGLPGAPTSAVGPSFVAGGMTGGYGGSLASAQGARSPAPAVGASGAGAGAVPGAAAPVKELTADPFALQPTFFAPSSIELEKLLPEMNNQPGFIELKNGDTLPSQNLNVRVKGPAGAALRLKVNDTLIDLKRVGKKATLAQNSATAWEYIGVQLKPGKNQLLLEVTDEFGISRAAPVEIMVVAPDKLGAVHLKVPAQARADLKTPIPVQIRLTDAQGVPVTARTQLTLETDVGAWEEKDLNPQEPGLQVFLEGGQGVFHVIPPGVPGDMRVRVSTSSFVKEARLTLLPELRPMIAVGVVEGTLDLSKRGALALNQAPAAAAFEQELTALNGGASDSRAGGRAAFFLKGAIQGEYLLTAALDTAKSSKERLFREIRPDEFYPVYGDASGKGYDAQSSERLYVRIDKDRSFLLYGDFITASSQEVRRLSQVNRTLTGVKNVYHTEDARVTSYVSRTSQKKQVEEFPSNGTSGPYYLAGGGGDVLVNSEQVEIVVRDRNQPNVILSKTSMVRYVDYTFEPLSRRLLFTRAIPSISPELHPQSVSVTYEVDGGGAKYTVAGVDAQVKVNDKLQVGVVANTDQNPEAKRDLTAVTALARLDNNTAVAAEWVNTQSDLNGAGQAARAEIRHENEQWGASAQVVVSDRHFDNPDAGFTGGRTETNARGEYRLDKTTALRGEVSRSHDASAGTTKQGASVGVLKKINEQVTGEVGLRYASGGGTQANSLFSYGSVSTTGAGATGGQVGNSVTPLGAAANVAAVDAGLPEIKTVRAKVTANVPDVPQAQVFGEVEQSIASDNKGRVAAVGGQYALSEKSRLYGRYEFDSSLYAQSHLQTTRNVGILGVESNYMEGGRVFNEYRLADASTGRGTQAATGVRNMFKLDDHWRTTLGVEKTKAIGLSNGTTIGQGDSTAIITGLEYANDGIRGSGVLEGRHGSEAKTLLASFGLGIRIDQDLTFLTRNIYNASIGAGTQAGNERTLSRNQIGLAYRPVGQDIWNLLGKFEHKTEHAVGAGTVSPGTISGNAFGTAGILDGDYVADIVSLHLNVNPNRGQYFSGRLAAKRASLNDSGISSSYSAQLISGRWIQDINADWDWGIQASLMRSAGSLQRSWGVELGYQAMKDFWLSVGYNFTGLSDRDLTAGEYTNKGLFLRARMKFDEVGLGLMSPKQKLPN